MNRLRSIVFAIVFYGLSTPIVLATPIMALFGQPAVIAHALRWARFHRWCARHLLGIVTRVEGTIPDTPVLYAAKHQSMYETMELALILGAPAIVLKAELARMPAWGWAARRYGCIAVDRAGSATALRGMMREAKAARATGRAVLIFPEGTRVPPGTQPPLQPGFAGLYRALALPVVAIALDSGRVWPRHGEKRPGVVTMRFADPIAPGVPREEIEVLVHGGMNVLDR